ncbi:MAG TPA: hypothetical protein VKT30_14965 [Caulobacteraceae bacterium]|nr:hypothetical protein [Caulobacteraceae bacterium]
MQQLVRFPLRYAPVILVATVVAANREPLWWFLVLTGMAIVLFPFVSPDRLRQAPTVYRAEVVVESPWVALAVAVGYQLGRMWPS